jgi:hypothetical protein
VGCLVACFENPDVRKIPVLLVIVQTIPDDKLIRDGEDHMVRLKDGSTDPFLSQQHGGLQLGWLSHQAMPIKRL